MRVNWWIEERMFQWYVKVCLEAKINSGTKNFLAFLRILIQNIINTSLFEANFSTRTCIYTHIVQKKRKEKEKKKYSFQRIFESKKFDWNEKSRETLKLRLAPFYDDLLSERRGGRRERERERENCRTLEFTLSSASTNGDRKRRTKGQKFKINTCRGRFGKEIVIRVKHLSPLNKGIFLRIIRTLLFL